MSPRTEFEVLAGVSVLVLLAGFGIIAHLLVHPLGINPVGGGFIGWGFGRYVVAPRRQAFVKRNSD